MNEIIMPFPKKMMLEVTNYCNNRCVFCASPCSDRKRGMVDKDFAMDKLKEAYDLGVREVGFHGMGEPFLYKNLGTLVEYAKKIGYSYIYLDTNGILAKPKVVNPVIDAGLDSIKFSIHAITSDTYYKVNQTDNFNLVKENLERLYQYKKENGLDFKLVTFFAENIYNTHEKELFREEMSKYSEVWISPIHNAAGNRESENRDIAITENISAWKGKMCTEPFSRLTIAWNGDVMACCTDWTGQLVYGNAMDCKLDEIWNNERIKKIRESLLKRQTNMICNSCIGY